MAARQLGSFRAARADLGMGDMVVGDEEVVMAYRGLGLKTLTRERVVIG
jgi:hypothetical protein